MLPKNALFFLVLLTGFNPVFSQNIALVVHGGAGNIYKEQIPDSLEMEYRRKLEESLLVGFRILNSGGESIEAVKAVINILEDSPLFNAGKGAVFTNSGTNEMDASIMDGATLNAGSVAGVKHIKNPIDAAIAVMNQSPHVFMAGEGAEKFAKMHDITMVDSDYFYTQKRFDQLQRIKQDKSKSQGYLRHDHLDSKFGTVGAVAIDKDGNIVAGTSTGGMTNKKFGRIGDSPIIGAGNYANNKTCGISATGHGEYFIRNVVAYDISALMQYKSLGIQEAADLVVQEKLASMGASGGVIGLDSKGNIMMSFNSNGMFRGYIKEDANPVVQIFRGE